ncbi:hypothetical protein [Lysobacter firmicutimachus]|uniref:Uncharacterized protein n=1 Tax=Lysobacter firmicutimachus TaxID=1792846 RepID=A0ABU8D0R6_9GAMM
MRGSVILASILFGCSFSAATAATNQRVSDGGRTQIQTQQQSRLQALAKRGRYSNYQQLLGAGQVQAKHGAVGGGLKGARPTPEQMQALTQQTAVDLAALGFTAKDVAVFQQSGIDLFDIAQRFFAGSTTAAEQMLMADTVVIATAGKTMDGRARLDGFLSTSPFTVVKSLKGARAPGDMVYVPRKSGANPDGTVLTVTSDIEFTVGKKYLLVLSKNWYEQWVAEKRKQTEAGFIAVPYLAYEILPNDTLRDGPRATRSGEDPRSVAEAANELKKFSPGKRSAGGAP